VGQHGAGGSTVPGALLLVAWAASVVLARRSQGAPALRSLHLVLGVALVFELVAMSRIFGEVFFYLMLWSLATAALMLVAIGWSVVAALGRAPVRDTVTAALAATTIVFVVLFALDAHDARMPLADLGRGLAGVLPPTEAALHRMDANRDGRRYLVTWDDPIALGGRGFAFLNELERAGFDVGAAPQYRTAVTGHRIAEPRDAAAQVHLAVGADIDDWRARPGVSEVVRVDPRTPAERAESDRLRREVDADLRARGLGELVGKIDTSLYAAITNPRMPAADRAKLRRIGDLDLPAAVFIAAPEE
jgi:hypothetical protein